MPRTNPRTLSSVPVSLAPEAPDFNAKLTALRDAFGSQSPLGNLAPLPQSDLFAQEEQRAARREASTAGDALGSMVRQDSPIDGWVAAYVGEQFMPDPAFKAEEGFEEKVKGLPPEYHHELLKAVSAEHQLYIRSRLDDKLADLQRLGDLGIVGNAARLLVGFVEPTNLALGLVSGGAASAVRRAGTAAQIGVGLGTGAASGYAFERARQSANFEDSNADAVWAGLMGLAFSAPFVGLSAAEARRLRTIASKELHGEDVSGHAKEHEAAYRGDVVAAENGPVPRSVAVEEPVLPNAGDPLGLTPQRAPAAEPEAIAAGSIGSSQTSAVPVEITPFSRIRIPFVNKEVSARLDIAAFFNESQNPVIQSLGRLLVRDPINASKHYAQGRSVSEDKKMLTRTVAGNFFFESSSAYKEAAKALGYGFVKSLLPSTAAKFHDDVGRFMRDPSAYSAAPHRAQLERAANAARKAYGTMLEEMQKAGVRGADTLAANPNYLNRVWMPDRIHALRKSHGPDTVDRLVASAIKDKAAIIQRFREKNPQSALTDDAILQASAAKFLNSVMKLQHSRLSNDLLLHATDAPTLRAELGKAGLSRAETDALIDNLFEVQEATSGDAGKPANLKYRFNLDESASITTDSGQPLRMADLLENDVRVLMDRYMNSMGGHVALARRGIRSRADYEALIREADADHDANALSRSGEAFGKEKQFAHDLYDHLVGRPMSFQTFNTSDQLAGILRAYGRSVYLGQLGFTAMNEAFHAANLTTWRAAVQQIPTLADAVKAARAGHRPDKGLVRDLSDALGVFNEMVSGHVRQHEITDFTYDSGLRRFDNAANVLSHATDTISGNAFMTTLTRGMAAAGMVQKYANFARGKLKLTDEWRSRIVGSGIDADDIDHVLSRLKEHVELDGERVVGLRHEAWSAADPKSYHDFITAVDRDVRQGVQDHDIGETARFQHTSLGKFFTELRAFNIAAHPKQFLNALHYRDRTSFQLFATSAAVNGLAYVIQTSANFAHDPKELEKRLTDERIAKAILARSSLLGLTPFFADTVIPGFISPLAQTSGQGLTANTDARNLLMPPSFNLLAKAVNFTQKGDVKDGLTLLPFSNTYGARNLIDMVSKAYPETKAP